MVYIYYWDENRKELAFAINQRKKEVQICFNLEKVKGEEKRKEAENRFQLCDYKGIYSENFDCEYLINSEEEFQKGIELVKSYLT